jgi:hypothetical protein
VTAPAAVLVEPAFRSYPAFTRTLGPEVADLARLVGFPPEPEQELGLDVIFALGAAGKSAAFEVGIACCRQNMKTGLYKQAALGWLFVTEQRLIVWSAHEFATSAEAFRDLRDLIDGCAWLSRRVKRMPGGHGDESIELMSGQRTIFKTRTKSGGRGLTGDKVVLDEAMFLEAGHMGSLLPTLSARPDPQVLYGGSAGHAGARVWRGVRDRGRAGSSRRLAWLEWCDDLPGACADPGCDHRHPIAGCRLDSEPRRRRANPAMGRTRVFDGEPVEILTAEYVQAEREALADTPGEFARERLGWWDEPGGTGVIPEAAWAARAGAAGRPDPPVAFGIAASWPDGEIAAIGSAGRLDGELLLQVVDRRPGIGWLVGRAKELLEHRPCAFVIDPGGPAGPAIPELEAAGVELMKVTGREACHAAGALLAAVAGPAPDARHYGQPELDASVADASKHHIGDVWRWDRNGSSAPIEAVTLAAYGHAVKAGAGQAFFAAYR